MIVNLYFIFSLNVQYEYKEFKLTSIYIPGHIELSNE